MRLLLLNPQGTWVSFDKDLGAGNRDFGDYLGIRYVAAVARQKGHHVSFVDAQFHGQSLDDIKNLIQESAGEQIDLIGISAIEHTIPLLLEIVPVCREVHPSALICVGGYAASFWWKELLERVPELDLAVFGEGELTFGELLERIEAKSAWDDLKGIAYRSEDGTAVCNPPRELLDLNALPWPVRDPFYPRGYANILSSRGCYGHCTFCSIIRFYGSSPGTSVRVRDPQDVVDEIAELQTRGVSHVDFVDDNFVSGAKTEGWVDDFCAGMARLDKKVTFGLQMRPDDVDENMLRKLRLAGLKIVSIGVESDIDDRLKLLGKFTNKGINRSALDILNNIGFDVYVEMLLFQPNSTLADIRENLDFLREIQYWNYVRITPSTFKHALQLYRGIPLLTFYQRLGVVREKQNGFGYTYEYIDAQVPKLLRRVHRWREHAARVANYHLAYFQFPLAAQGDVGTALRSIRLSKKFLKYDLEVFFYLLQSVEENVPDHLVEDWMQTQLSKIADFENKFSRIANSVPTRTAYKPAQLGV
jgi:5-methoxy-6-methylbenzimidazole methyltransferase